LLGEKTLLGFDSFALALWRGFDTRFVLIEQLLDPAGVEAQGLALVGPAQAFEQLAQRQVWHLVVQTLAKTHAEAVGQILLVLVSLYAQAAADSEGG
jgi:hypothetical protein